MHDLAQLLRAAQRLLGGGIGTHAWKLHCPRGQSLHPLLALAWQGGRHLDRRARWWALVEWVRLTMYATVGLWGPPSDARTDAAAAGGVEAAGVEAAGVGAAAAPDRGVLGGFFRRFGGPGGICGGRLLRLLQLSAARALLRWGACAVLPQLALAYPRVARAHLRAAYRRHAAIDDALFGGVNGGGGGGGGGGGSGGGSGGGEGVGVRLSIGPGGADVVPMAAAPAGGNGLVWVSSSGQRYHALGQSGGVGGGRAGGGDVGGIGGGDVGVVGSTGGGGAGDGSGGGGGSLSDRRRTGVMGGLAIATRQGFDTGLALSLGGGVARGFGRAASIAITVLLAQSVDSWDEGRLWWRFAVAMARVAAPHLLLALLYELGLGWLGNGWLREDGLGQRATAFAAAVATMGAAARLAAARRWRAARGLLRLREAAGSALAWKALEAVLALLRAGWHAARGRRRGGQQQGGGMSLARGGTAVAGLLRHWGAAARAATAGVVWQSQQRQRRCWGRAGGNENSGGDCGGPTTRSGGAVDLKLTCRDGQAVAVSLEPRPVVVSIYGYSVPLLVFWTLTRLRLMLELQH